MTSQSGLAKLANWQTGKLANLAKLANLRRFITDVLSSYPGIDT